MPGRTNQPSTKSRTKSIIKWLAIIFTILIYTFLTTAIFVLYGPFENIRRTLVGAILTSSHPYVIKPFYSAATLVKYEPVSPDKMAKGTLTTKSFANVHDETIQEIPIHSDRYSGELLLVHDPKRIHVAITKHLGVVGQTVSQMAEENQAVAAINAGGFTDATGGTPMGLTMSFGSYVTGDKVKPVPMIAFTSEGELKIGTYTYKELQDMHVTDSVSFGPQLIEDGKPYLSSSDGSWGLAPRSAIGQRKDGTVLFLALTGRGNGGIGASLIDCEKVLLENGAWTAVNLDGGYSSELFYNHKLLVPPSNPLGERYVATSFIVSKNS